MREIVAPQRTLLPWERAPKRARNVRVAADEVPHLPLRRAGGWAVQEVVRDGGEVQQDWYGVDEHRVRDAVHDWVRVPPVVVVMVIIVVVVVVVCLIGGVGVGGDGDGGLRAGRVDGERAEICPIRMRHEHGALDVQRGEDVLERVEDGSTPGYGPARHVHRHGQDLDEDDAYIWVVCDYVLYEGEVRVQADLFGYMGVLAIVFFFWGLRERGRGGGWALGLLLTPIP